jgi:hypothetical protein
MSFRSLRRSWSLAILAPLAATACGSSSPPTEDAFVSANVLDSAAGTCNEHSSTSIVQIGQAVAGKPSTVNTGGSEGAGTVTLSCNVSAVNSGFDIQLQAEQAGTGGGVITITSPLGQGTVSPTATSVSGITGNFNNPQVGHYLDSNCTLTYTYNGAPVPTMPPVAGGRIWGHLDCPNAVLQGQTGTGGSAIVCDAQVDFLFENCGGS